MSIRPTIKDIATKAGVHHSTVSRALANNRRIPVATRERILKIAGDLGYKPDPFLSGLVAYRQSKTHVKYQATLAWVTNYPTRDGWKNSEKIAYFQGAKRRASELGFEIEEFWLSEPGMTQQRATRILNARNTQGLFFIPQPRSRAHLRLEWASFSAITFGHTLARPIFHSVNNDHFRSFAILMRRLKRLGYRKPGFAYWLRTHESTDRAWAAAFWAYQSLPPAKQIPIFMKEPWTVSDFKKWYLRYKPDVVISHHALALQWLEEMNLRVPDDVGFVMSAKHIEAPDRCAGINENNERVGEVAVNVLVQMINHNERGAPVIPISTQVEGSWIEGSTLKRQWAPQPK